MKHSTNRQDADKTQYLPINLHYFGEQDPQVNPPKDPPAEPNPESAVNPDEPAKPSLLQMTQEELTRKMAKEKGEGKRSIYNQLGVKDDAEFTAFMQKWAEIKEAEAEAEKNKPELERLKGELAAKSKIEADYKAAQEKLALLELNELIREKGVADPKEIKLAKYEIRELMASGKDMTEAAEEYFTANPVDRKPDAPPRPQIVPGTPASPVTPTEAEKLKNEYKEAVSKKQWNIVSLLTRTAKEKNITLE